MERDVRVLPVPFLIAALAAAPAGCGGSGGGGDDGSAPDAGASTVSREAARAIFTGEGADWIDLTHPFDEEAIYWPTAEAFALDTVSEGTTEADYYYSAYRFSAAEHGGTHLDAPVHFHRGGETVDAIGLDRLVGPAVVVDVSEAAAEEPDYRASVADFRSWEAAHGPIPDGAIVLVRTGWGERWPDAKRYLGTDRRGPEAVPDLHFPGIHPEAARWLAAERSVAAVGLDTPSIDHGPSTEFMAHRVLYEAGIPGFENVARLESLPPAGAYVVALPMKIAGGSGAPLRIVGVVPRAR